MMYNASVPLAESPAHWEMHMRGFKGVCVAMGNMQACASAKCPITPRTHHMQHTQESPAECVRCSSRASQAAGRPSFSHSYTLYVTLNAAYPESQWAMHMNPIVCNLRKCKPPAFHFHAVQQACMSTKMVDDDQVNHKSALVT